MVLKEMAEQRCRNGAETVEKRWRNGREMAEKLWRNVREIARDCREIGETWTRNIKKCLGELSRNG